MRSLGICIGASTLSAVEISRNKTGQIERKSVNIKPHNGNPREALMEALKELNANDRDRITVTGRKFRYFVNMSTISEPEAVEAALFHLNGNKKLYDAIVSAGGETFMVYVLGNDGRICSVQTGNKCASGTGEFFIQQLRRIGLTLEEAIRFGYTESPYKVSGRCSVFCKSDCTHATNKGVPKGRIAAGLCEMMAGKIIEIIRQTPRDNIMIIGGTAQNPIMIRYLQKEIKNLIVPEEASFFEAWGAAIWGIDNETSVFPGIDNLFKKGENSFALLPPLKKFFSMVDFKSEGRGIARENDRCIIGLDVGSTTTKAVILRTDDDKILASIYLRTEGNPVQASRLCYADLYKQLGPLADKINIVGLGVTGSGRQIAGLHAMTRGIVNEIIAHATGALFFDKNVDTIFEIGGQDAKYTYIKNGIPSDYAMNDACSAGTGSFLEEAAKETMGIAMEEIGGIALKGLNPPNFNDQCAAFISSDIKNASHEGMTREDIVAGLVYSICMNYDNRVKGSRSVGSNIFMQGGVCYNQAVPIAMASLTGKKIVVPPEPGLMGAFGVALEIKRMLKLGILEEKEFSLKDLKDRAVDYGEPFTCEGGKEKCDRKCKIARLIIDGKIYPFGGACNKWYNLRFNIDVESEKLNYVRKYEETIFKKMIPPPEDLGVTKVARTVGINKSFTVNNYYPLYYHFFSRIGFRVVLSEEPDKSGQDRKTAPFCYPAELAHGFFSNLLDKAPDYVLLPHVLGIYVENCAEERTVTCPLSQGEPYYLSSAFKDHDTFRDLMKKGSVLKPVIDFSKGYEATKDVFIEMAKKMRISKKIALQAFTEALSVQESVHRSLKEAGREFLADLETNPEKIGVVIFGRPYNAFVSEANMGIPHKFASRGISVLPVNSLPIEDEECLENMYWSSGQLIIKGANYVKKHPQIFGCFISNFSCGPDSFLFGYFKDIMDTKPFLLLELDSHVADAGLETRIEAFLDIIRNHIELRKRGENLPSKAVSTFKPAYFDAEKQEIIDSKGRGFSFNHPRVHLIFPSMGQFLNDSAAAVFKSIGIRATPLPPADEEVLKLGRGNTTCKECLPLLLTVGSLLKYLKYRENEDELLIYFMPTASGPCRFGQYSTFIDHMIARSAIPDVATFSLQAENSYRGLSAKGLTLKIWASLVVTDILQDIYSVILTCAKDQQKALEIFYDESRKLIKAFEEDPTLKHIKNVLKPAAERFRDIQLIRSPKDTPSILLTGEIFVRHDDLSRQFIVERLAEKGFITKVSSVIEWIYYTDWCFKNGYSAMIPNLRERADLLLRAIWMKSYERSFKKIMARSNLFRYQLEDVDHLIKGISHLINPRLTGEAVLTVGAGISEIIKKYCGVIAIGPFGCMPNRLAESILTTEMGAGSPFFAIESDGSPFPQIINAKLEVFLLQAKRVHEKMMSS